MSNRVTFRHDDIRPAAPTTVATVKLGRQRVNRPSGPAIFAWVTLFLAGCSPIQLAHRTLHDELNEFPRLTDGKASCRQYKRWAQEEWQRLTSTSPEALSPDYESGFLQGFVDHVYAGGRLTPPVMPPRRYWRLPYRNEAGQLAVREWYAGFEHGARVAHEGGYRDRAVIPSSMLDEATEDEWIELEPVPNRAKPTDEVRPPEPSPAEEPTVEVPEPEFGPEEELAPPAAIPSAEPTSDSGRALTPGGLPLPTDAVPAVRRPQARNAGTGTVAARNAGTGTVADAAAPAAAAQADAGRLQLDPAADAPPAPPWAGPPVGGSDPPRNIRLASAQATASGDDMSSDPGNSGKSTEANLSEVAPPVSVLEFDPFAGTQFAALSRVSSGANGPDPEGTPAGSTSPPSSSGTASANDHGSWVATDNTSSAAARSTPNVAPLDVIATVPSGASSATAILQAPTSPAPKPPLPTQPMGRDVPAPSAGPPDGAESASPSPNEPSAAAQPTEKRAEPAASSSGAESSKPPDGGWQAVETESETRWKRKE